MAPERRVLRRFLSRSAEATEALGEALGKRLDAGSILALDGDLGTGKTCFVRGLARGLDVADRVTSPTFALLQTYSGRLELHHFDAWMEGRERAFLLDGGLEWLHSGGVGVIEWAERVADFLPEPRLWIGFEHRGLEERAITIAIEGAPMHAPIPAPMDATGRATSSWERVVAEIAAPDGLEEVA